MAGTVTKLRERLDPETKRLRALTDGDLADEAFDLNTAIGRIKAEAIRRAEEKDSRLRFEGQFGRVTLSVPGMSNRFDRKAAERTLGFETLKPFFFQQSTDWVMRITGLSKSGA